LSAQISENVAQDPKETGQVKQMSKVAIDHHIVFYYIIVFGHYRLPHYVHRFGVNE